MDIDDRVAIGARFLDDTVPNWRALVSLDRLDMSNMHACVLGQLYGWPLGVKALDEWWETQDVPTYGEPQWEVAGFEKCERRHLPRPPARMAARHRAPV